MTDIISAIVLGSLAIATPAARVLASPLDARARDLLTHPAVLTHLLRAPAPEALHAGH
jgi:hypothetical protein